MDIQCVAGFSVITKQPKASASLYREVLGLPLERYEMTDYRFDGDRFRARQRGVAAADWLVVGPEGTGTLDVRVTLETPEGAVVLLRYGGRVDASRGLGGAPIYAAPQFETGDERYAWLNRIQAIAKGTLTGSSLAYEVYEVR